MALFALNLASTRDYESGSDPDKGTPGATVFKLGTIDSRVMAMLRDDAVTHGAAGTYIASRTQEFRVVQHGLRGVKNFASDKGPIELTMIDVSVHGTKYAIVDPAVIAQFDPALIEELAAEIRSGNTVSKEEAKN